MLDKNKKNAFAKFFVMYCRGQWAWSTLTTILSFFKWELISNLFKKILLFFPKAFRQ